jgi:pilus assembly protein Flp/PilA
MGTILAARGSGCPQERQPGRVKQVQKPVIQEKGGEIAEMLSLYWKLRSLTTRQEGQGMVEYALILVLVSIVVIVILLTMGNQIKNVFSNVVAALGA